MNKVTLEKLTVELTEKCNMKCLHCCKGEAGNTDIDLAHIDKLLDQVEMIGMLYLSGGEPTLNLDAIEYICEAIRKRNIPLFEFQITTNALIYDEKFIKIIKNYKQLIDTSRRFFDSTYNPKENLHRCIVAVSLDRFHSDHDLCFANYEKYKSALSGHAEVIKKMQGNSPFRFGRAKELKENTWDMDYKLEFQKQQRIELFSKEFNSPACKAADQYKLAYEDQKIVCCGLYMNAQGNLYIEHCEVMDRETVNTFPVICKAGDSLWGSLPKYNKDKLPCKQCMELIHEKAKATDNLNSLDKIAFDACNDAMDELTEHDAKIVKEQWINGIETTLAIQKSQFHSSFEQIVRSNPLYAKLLLYVAERKGICDSDYLKELREEFFQKGKDLRSYKQAQSKIQRPAVKCQDGLRCFWCGKVIRTQENKNIHCALTGQGLECRYCHSVNTQNE